MPTTYSLADSDVHSELARVMERWHPRLKAAAVRVGVLMASNPDGPAVVFSGYPAIAKIQIVSLKDRVVKSYDAELVIDERDYEQMRSGQRIALLDHELSHIDTVDLDRPEGPVTWKTDDIGRPKLKSVKGDWNAGDGFVAVVERHGLEAIEYENLQRSKGRADAARRAGSREEREQ